MKMFKYVKNYKNKIKMNKKYIMENNQIYAKIIFNNITKEYFTNVTSILSD